MHPRDISTLYKVLVVVEAILVISLLICAGIGNTYYDKNEDLAYFITGYILACLVMINLTFNVYIFAKAPHSLENIERKSCMGNVMLIQYYSGILTVMLCISVAVVCGITYRDYRNKKDTENSTTNKRVALALLSFTIIVFIEKIVTMILVAKLGPTFGVHISKTGTSYRRNTTVSPGVPPSGRPNNPSQGHNNPLGHGLNQGRRPNQLPPLQHVSNVPYPEEPPPPYSPPNHGTPKQPTAPPLA